jgi:hypothetical protein
MQMRKHPPTKNVMQDNGETKAWERFALPEYILESSLVVRKDPPCPTDET